MERQSIFTCLPTADRRGSAYLGVLAAGCRFLAHLSQRLIGELIGYSWSSVRPSSVVRLSSFTMLKDLLLRNRFDNQSQILCGASLGRWNESLFAASETHDQDGRHPHIWEKTLQKSSSPEPAGRFSRNLVCSIGDSSPS